MLFIHLIYLTLLIVDAEFAQRLEPNNQEIKKQHAELRAFVGKVSLVELSFQITFVKYLGLSKTYILVNVEEGVVILQMSYADKIFSFNFYCT